VDVNRNASGNQQRHSSDAEPVKSLPLGTAPVARQNGAMDETPTTPKPRRRWKRWAALVLVLAVALIVWASSTESPTIRLSHQLRVGMTKAEVHAIMGEPAESFPGRQGRPDYETFATPLEMRLENLRSKCEFLLAKLRSSQSTSWIDKSPVRVRYDDGHVVYIARRGIVDPK
jgi:hypothetical protein